MTFDIVFGLFQCPGVIQLSEDVQQCCIRKSFETGIFSLILLTCSGRRGHKNKEFEDRSVVL